MLQQFLAIIIIAFIIFRLVEQKKKNNIGSNEFILWMFFWFSSVFVIIFIKQVDSLVAKLGFSSSGIEVLLYLSVVVLIYLVFRLRIRLERQEREITKIVREISLKDK